MIDEKILELYLDAKSKRQDIDKRIPVRNALYEGKPQEWGKKGKKAKCLRNMCFELIETQVNNSIPAPKITPRDPDRQDAAYEAEGYLSMEMDRLNSEQTNDSTERSTIKQGTVFYMVGWDETKNTPTTSGELFVKPYTLDKIYPQPGILDIKDAEYVFVEDTVSVKKIKEVYGVTVEEGPDFKGMATLVTYYYYDKNGDTSRYGWIKDTDQVVFDEQGYECRKIKVCKECGEPMHDHSECPVCGSKKYEYVSKEYETLTEDIVKYNKDDPKAEPQIIAKAGTQLKYYKVRQLPFVRRVNISKDDSLYGISDIDVLEENQMSMNKILSKMEENVLKAGSFMTKPQGVNIPLTDETLKVVTVKDPEQVRSFSVQTIQANMQQENILQEQIYQMGRDSLGITDSYQGKRDTTAESGKAKQVSAAQAAGRMESKRRMKDAAYADLYELMFKFLLAYCDEKRTYARMQPDGTYVEGHFSRYNYLDGTGPDDIHYNDRFLFSVDDSTTITNNRATMWNECTQNFMAGTFGNPQDPQTMLLYWNMMKGLNYPLAKQVIENLSQRQQQLPYDMQQAIMQNPQVLATVQDVLTNPEKYQEAQNADSKRQD